MTNRPAVQTIGAQWRELMARHELIAVSKHGSSPDEIDRIVDELHRLMHVAAEQGPSSEYDVAVLIHMAVVDHGIDLNDGSAGSAALKAVLEYLDGFRPELQEPQHSD